MRAKVSKRMRRQRTHTYASLISNSGKRNSCECRLEILRQTVLFSFGLPQFGVQLIDAYWRQRVNDDVALFCCQTHINFRKNRIFMLILQHTHTHSCMPSIMATIVVCTCWPVRKIASCIDDNNDNHSFCNAALHPPSPLTSLDFAMPCRQRRQRC